MIVRRYAITSAQERCRHQNIRALFLVASVEEMERARANYGSFERAVLQEMIDTCERHGVKSFGETPA
jgi:hypothetical protein